MLRAQELKRRIKASFVKIKEEINDHLTAINENTNEIQSNYEQMCILEMKIDKLTERMDELQMMISCLDKPVEKVKEEYAIKPLSKREKEVFSVLSSIQAVKDRATYEEVAKRCSMTQPLIVAYLTTMLQKGIPLVKRYIGEASYISVDESFLAFQQKSNVLNIEEELTPESES